MLTIDHALAARLELTQAWRSIHYIQAQQQLDSTLGGAVLPVGDGYAVYGGPGSPVQRVVGLGMTQPVTAAVLDEVEDFFRQCQISPRIDLCPLADPSLRELLAQRGYHLQSFHNVLVCTLSRPEATPVLPHGLHITQVTATDGPLWIQTTAQGFDACETPSPATLAIMMPNFYAANATCFLAWIDDQPAGGGAMYHHAGVVELGGASTRPAFRQRGVQTALLAQRLAAAAAAGCDLALVGTAPGSASQRNIARAGFQLAYTKVVMSGQ